MRGDYSERDAMAARREASSDGVTGARKALVQACLRSARSRHGSGVAEHNHAPRPGRVRPTRSAPSAFRTTRISSSWGPLRRQPTQVRVGV